MEAWNYRFHLGYSFRVPISWVVLITDFSYIFIELIVGLEDGKLTSLVFQVRYRTSEHIFFHEIL